jgi:hypothetical protein
VEELVTLPKVFEFSEDARTRITLSDATKVHLSLEDRLVVLQRVPTAGLKFFEAPTYPTDEDLYVATWLAKPKAVTQWLKFDFWGTTPDGTSLGFRLSDDGIVQQYWDGSTWSPATNGHVLGTTWVPGNWNTVQEVTDHISEFSAAAKAIQVIINLKTTYPTVTPSIQGVGIAYEAFIDQDYDLNENSLMAYLGELRPMKDWIFRLVDDSVYITIKAGEEYNVGTFNVVDVTQVYDQTNDSQHTVNLFTSYDSATGKLTFTKTVSAGIEVWIRFSYQPTVAITTEQDYALAHIPALVIDNMDELHGARMQADIAFKDRAAGTALIVRGPYRATLRYTLRLIADRGRDLSAIRSKLLQKFTQEPLLVSYGTGERYSMQIQKGVANFGSPNLSDLLYKHFTIDILDVCYWTAGTLVANLVTTGLKTSGDLSFLSGSAERP